MKRFIMCTAALAALAGTQAVQAQSQTTSIAASAEVSTVCSVTATPMAFGEVALTGVTDGTASVTATCTNGGPYDIGLDDGVNAVDGQRTLVSGANSLNYDLFSDTTHADRWGNIIGEDAVTGVGDGTAQLLTVYGQIPAGQAINAGNGASYADTVQVTITY
jgi:spore coat protein U-like protein